MSPRPSRTGALGRASLWLAALILSSHANPVTGGEISIDSWDLSTVTYLSGNEDVDGTGVVQNPFQKHDHAQMTPQGGMTFTADTDYTAAWDSQGVFNFLVEAQHTSVGNPDLFSRSAGTIYVTPSVDSILHIGLSYNYTLISGIRYALVSVGAGVVGEDLSYFDGDVANNLVVPPMGQLTLDSGDIPMSPGLRYQLFYQIELGSFSGSPDVHSHGDGSLQIAITPAPEVSTCSMLAISCLPMLVRRRRPRGANRRTTAG